MTGKMFAIAGALIVFFASAFYYYKRRRLIRNGQAATGEIVDTQKSGDDIFPVIGFTTPTGHTVTRRYKVSHTGARIGDKVTLYYDPGKPDRFIVDGKVEKIGPLVGIASSLIFIVLYFLFFDNK